MQSSHDFSGPHIYLLGPLAVVEQQRDQHRPGVPPLYAPAGRVRRRYLLGAVCPATGQGNGWIISHTNIQTMSADAAAG